MVFGGGLGLLGASGSSGGASMRSGDALVAVARVWSLSSGRAGEQHVSPSPRNQPARFPRFNSKTLVTQSCSEVKNSSCARRKQRGSTKMAAVLALAEGLKKSAPFHQSKYSSRLSETPLYERTGFAVNWHVHPHWSRLIAWSRPSSHWQHRRRRPSYKFILNPPSRWGQSFAAGSTRLPPAP